MPGSAASGLLHLLNTKQAAVVAVIGAVLAAGTAMVHVRERRSAANALELERARYDARATQPSANISGPLASDTVPIPSPRGSPAAIPNWDPVALGREIPGRSLLARELSARTVRISPAGPGQQFARLLLHLFFTQARPGESCIDHSPFGPRGLRR